MLSRWQGGLAALIVTLLVGLLVVDEITDGAVRRWWSGHALTTDTVSGLLVLLITLLVVDQVVRLRQINDRARAVAAQAAIIMTQAVRASGSVSQALADGADENDRDTASDQLRTYMMMLLVGAPVLIDARVSRTFLEQAQAVGGLMANALGVTASSSGQAALARLDGAVQQLQAAAAPLLQVLSPETQAAVRGDESPLPVPVVTLRPSLARRATAGRAQLRLAQLRLARGSWPGGGWPGCEWAAPAAEREWRGFLTVDALRILRANGRWTAG